MWIRYILWHNVTCFFIDLCFRTNDFDSFTTRAIARFHNIHMFVPWTFPLQAELPIIIWKYICFRTEVIFISTCKKFLCSLNIFPHMIFPTYLETLREMIYLLIFGCLFKHIGFTNANPYDIPFPGTRRHDPNACCFHGIYHRIVNMSRVMYLEAHGHIFIHHFILMYYFDLCVTICFNTRNSIDYL